MNYQLYVLENTGDKALFNKKVIQLNTLFDALISSGNGTTKEDAFYVIETTHEYDLISILGLTFGGQQSHIEHYDYLTLAANEAEIEGLYFDITPCLNSLSRMFED
ncbi:MAG: DUF4919 domain-containing protein [Algicola sp.]|nr:DUF4919 domain-containing protein [Algicola sp.]